MQFGEANDKLFVVAIKKDWAAVGFNESEYNWMKTIPDASWTS